MTDLRTTIDGVTGFQVAGVHAGLKKDDALDFSLIVSDRPCVSAGVFTRNLVKAAPVLVNMEHLRTHGATMRAVAINTKHANAGTGAQGMTNARTMAQWTAAKVACEPQQVYVMSTGVIGTQLPMANIKRGINSAYQQLGQDWTATARGIMTTDTYPKLASITVQTARGAYTIAGITKGAGMIAPNMATMLGVIVTDADLQPAFAHQALSATARVSYNRIVVDGDTSTNDMVVMLANGASAITLESADERAQFQLALDTLTTYLAQAVVRDGEGVTKFITIDVCGASDEQTAQRIAHTIAASPLVKTAFYGNDANWGRIMAAAGRAGVDFDPDRATLTFTSGETRADDSGVVLFRNGQQHDYDDAQASAIIREASVYVTLDLCAGDERAIVWTCDLSHDYVSINADYRT